ncbi:MAG: RNA polymerase sigma factor [Sphingomonadaceae bacterium]
MSVGDVLKALADEQLAERAALGDAAAFGELVERHQRFVFNLCLRALRDYELASEVAQDVFLRAWRSIGSFRGQARFTTWLYTIAHNLCMNRIGGLERDARQLVGEEDAAEELARIPSREEDPAEAYEKKELRGWIHRQIDRLPDRYRMVITLFYLQELSYQEIAEVTGLPIGTVKTHLFRAKEMLRRGMEDEVPPEPVVADGVCGGSPDGRGGSPPGGAPYQLRSVPTGAG